MWDEQFSTMNPEIGKKLTAEDATAAFNLMHLELFKVWKEVYSVLKPGGFACINIGDATRKVGDDFQLFSNHARIIEQMVQLGFHALPLILWRKATNSPTKFMGSGVLPSGAYVTLEHEYILIFRKGGKRTVTTIEEREKRQQSAMFWEERNCWYSDMWSLPGVRQTVSSHQEKTRKRNASFPLELPYRLINMYSSQGDTVLDPFAGFGTTMRSAMLLKRNSISLEWDKEILEKSFSSTPFEKEELNQRINKRVNNHLLYVEDYQEAKGSGFMKYQHTEYDFPVKSKQEQKIKFHSLKSIDYKKEENCTLISAQYSQWKKGEEEPLKPEPLFHTALSKG